MVGAIEEPELEIYQLAESVYHYNQTIHKKNIWQTTAYVYIYVCVCLCVDVCAFTCVYVLLCVCVCTYVYVFLYF